MSETVFNKLRNLLGLGGDTHKTQEHLERVVEAMSLHDHTPAQMESAANALPKDPMALRKERKRVRYLLYRIQTEANGGAAADGADTEFRRIFEAQDNFGGWRYFGVTWDVALDDPYRCVHRDKSVTEEWEEVVRKKFPIILPGGQVVYPDRQVRRQMEAGGER